MNQIEKVARALCRTWPDGNCNLCEGQDCHGWEAYIPDARAAIEAMREPTPEMMQVGDIEFRERENDITRPWYKVWPAMIDKALEG